MKHGMLRWAALAWLALFGLVVAPTISRALAAREAAAPAWARVCSANASADASRWSPRSVGGVGVPTATTAPTESNAPAEPDSRTHDACALCVLQGHGGLAAIDWHWHAPPAADHVIHLHTPKGWTRHHVPGERPPPRAPPRLSMTFLT